MSRYDSVSACASTLKANSIGLHEHLRYKHMLHSVINSIDMPYPTHMTRMGAAAVEALDVVVAVLAV